jgi:uncharacterized protein YndB with AHSA1/START domain
MSVAQITTPVNTLVVEAEYANMTPGRLFEYWTQPGLLTSWWPQEAEIDGRVGGAYHLGWSAMGRHLRGHYTDFEPGQRLGFTWRWDHDPAEEPTRHVSISFEALGNGTKMTVTHGPYDDSAHDQEIRNDHHLVGWRHFLAQLEQKLTG